MGFFQMYPYRFGDSDTGIEKSEKKPDVRLKENTAFPFSVLEIYNPYHNV